MAKQKNKLSFGNSLRLLFLGLTGLGLSITILLQNVDVALLNPKGFIAREEYKLFIFSIVLLLTIALPTILLLYFVAWKYRETNNKSTYNPDARQGKIFEFSIWAVPAVFMIVLALVMIPATHKLEPKKTIASDAKPITIQVVAMRWKWLFIYPEQNIATVNYVQIPKDTPVQFDLTADEAPMSSFWIPHLSGQLYAMTGHVNRLNVIADETGEFPGSSAEINGAGFAGMKFVARASSKDDFDKWVQVVQQSPDVLDASEYEKLLIPSEKNPTALYSKFDSDLYDKMLIKYMGSHDHQPANYEAGH